MTESPSPRDSLLSQLRSRLGDVTVVVISEGLARAAAFVAIPVAAIFLDDGELGVLAIGLLVFSVVVILYDFGLGGAAVRLYFKDPMDGSVWWLRFAIVGVGLPIVYLVAPIVTEFLFVDVDFYPVLAPVPIAAAAAAIVTVGQAFLRARFEFKSFGALTVARAAAVSLPAIVGVILTRSARGYLTGMAIGLGALAIVTLIAMRKSIGAPSRRQWRAAIFFGVPLVPHLLFGVVMNLADRVLVERWIGLTDLGQYALAYQLSWATAAVVLAVNNLWSPMLYRTAERDGFAATDSMVARAVWSVVAFGGLAAAATVVAARVLFTMLRPDATIDSRVFLAVAAASAANALYVLAVGPIFVRNKTWAIPVITGAGALANLGGNVLLIPRYGITGAAVATFGGFIVTLAVFIALGPRLDVSSEFLRKFRNASIAVFLASSVVIWIGGWAGVALAAIAAAAVIPRALTGLRAPRAATDVSTGD